MDTLVYINYPSIINFETTIAMGKRELYPGYCEEGTFVNIRSTGGHRIISNHANLGMRLVRQRIKFAGYERLGDTHGFFNNFTSVRNFVFLDGRSFPQNGTNVMYLELVYKINTPTRYSDDEIIIFKKYPVSMRTSTNFILECF